MTPASCADVQRMYNTFSDGEYCLSIAASSRTVGARIYCHDMSSCSPREYLTLPSGPDNNYSQTYKNTVCTTGLVKYHKIGVNLDNMTLKSWDWTFTSQSGMNSAADPCDSIPLFGRAFSCGSHPPGAAKIDLTDTGFYMEDTLQWRLVGYQATTYSHARTAQTFYGECTGNCGGCVPQDDSRISYLSYYADDATQKVMPVAFDTMYDTNQCMLP